VIRSSVWIGVSLLLIAGCQRKTQSNVPLARIDNRTLTADDIRIRFDTAQGITEAQLQQYVQRWLKDELLYRDALSHGYGNSKEIEDKLEEARRELVINEYLDKTIYNEKTASSTPAEIQAYYDAHKSEFVLHNDVALLSYLVFSNRDAANRFRNTVLRGTPWYTALHGLLNDPVQRAEVLTKGDSLYYAQASLLPADLWRVASAVTVKEPSFPVSTTEGYYIIIVWQFEKQGQPADLRLVEGEIRSRLAIERRSQLYDSLIANLRAKHSVEILIGSSGNDTTRLKSLE
jgi:PPIC-type PPIASE domain